MSEMTTRTLPRQARSARSLDLILDAAERLMHQQGVVETSTVDVAAAAGVSVGRLYYWFPDKDAVVNAVMHRAEQRMSEFVHEVVVDDPTVRVDVLVARMVTLLGRFFGEHPGSLAVLQRGPVDGDDPGRPLCGQMVDLASRILARREPDLDEAERYLVSNTCVRIALALLAEHVRYEGDDDAYLRELTTAITSYLSRRFPGA